MTELLIINGERVAASDGGTFNSIDPSTGDVLATVSKATKPDVDKAVDTAHAAFEGKAWGGMAPAERGRIMNRIAHAIRDRRPCEGFPSASRRPGTSACAHRVSSMRASIP